MKYYEKLRDVDKEEIYCCVMGCIYNTSVEVGEAYPLDEFYVCGLQNSLLIELFCPCGYKMNCLSGGIFYAEPR